MISRALAKLGLITAALLAIAAMLIVALPNSFFPSVSKDPGAWAVIAAALAVMTSVISSWSAQRMFELEEDALKPYPYPFIDSHSRYGLLQLRVKNLGGGIARDIRLTWDKPLLDSKGELVRFVKQEGAPAIPVLLPGESIAALIGEQVDLFGKYPDMSYSGEIVFCSVAGEEMKHKFFASAESFRDTLRYNEEEPKTHFQLQKIPNEIHNLRTSLDRFGVLLEQLLGQEATLEKASGNKARLRRPRRRSSRL